MRVRSALRKYVEALPWLFYKFRIIQKIFDSDNTFARVEDTLDLSQLTIGDNGNWIINGRDTGKTSRGEQGYTPYIQSGTWWINGVDTGFPSTGEDGKDGTDGVDGQDGITTNLNPESPNTTLRMWEGTRNQYDEQQPLGDDVITFIREL